MAKLSITVLGFVMEDNEFRDLLAVDEGMPVQTQRFGLSLVHALQAGGARVSLITASPTTNFPHNRMIRHQTKRTRVSDAEGIRLGFVNLPVAKHVTRLAAVFRHGPRELERTTGDALLIHGVHSPWLAFGAFASRRLGVTSVAVMTDPPNVPHEFDTSLTRFLKKLDERVVKRLVSHLDGVIVLTASLAEDFAPGRPKMVMEGIAPEGSAKTQEPVIKTGLPVVLYAGGLSEEYGIRLLLDAHALNPERFRLQIAGRGPLESLVRQRTHSQPNLEFLGMVAPQELPDLYSAADAFVNPRPPNQRFTRYSFPSKILEYMVASRPVVSMRLEGIPQEYSDVLVWADASVEGLSAALLALAEQSPQNRSERGEAGANFARTKCSAAQGKRIVAFVETLNLAKRSRVPRPISPHRY